ncbi:MAG: hypothetical protein ABII02_00745 [Candidatus Magasanikbacteria bacterium]
METEKEILKRSQEAEPTRESKEAEADPEIESAATMERADYLVKEVKQSKQQMQNILVHMQQVTQAIRQLRAQLQLADGGDPSSVAQDKHRIEELKKKISEHKDELIKMRDDLVREQVEELRDGVGVGMSSDELQKKAEQMVDEMIHEIEEL